MMRNKLILSILIVLSTIFGSSAFAFFHCDACLVAGMGVGNDWSKTSNTSPQTPNNAGYLPPYTSWNYDNNPVSSFNSSPLINLFAGYRWHFNNWYPAAVIVGLDYKYFINDQINGTVEWFSQSNQANYSYNVDYSSQLVTVFSKVEVAKFHDFAPYVLLGVGVGSNRFESYNQTPKTSYVVASPDYSAKTNTGFAGEVGFGLDYYMMQRAILSLGYEYVSLPGLKSGSGVQTYSGSTIDFGHVHANLLTFDASYIFD